MTTIALSTTAAPAAAATAKPRLLSRPLAAVCLADFAGLTSFYLLLSVVPAYATAQGFGGSAAGLATATLMLSTVIAELMVPRALARFGTRTVLAAGLALLGLPALALPFVSNWSALIATCLLRGAGLGIIFVACGALSAELIPAGRRGEGLGLLGIVAGVPAVLAMPLGVWLADRAGFTVVFLAGAATALAGLAAVTALPGRPARRQPWPEATLGKAFRNAALLRPAVVFASTAMAAGVLVTFLPGALPGGSANLAALALLVQAVAATGSRWWAGRWSDRNGAANLLVPGAVLVAIGVAVMVWTGSPLAVLAGSLLFGVGFGIAQNASLAVMYERAPASAFGAVTALWSVAYDGGLGAGAAGFGLLAGTTGFSHALAVVAGLPLLALVASYARVACRSNGRA